MGLFEKSKKGKHADNSDYIPEESGLKNPSFIHVSPHALTADEVLGNNSKPKHTTKDIPMQNANGLSPLEALRNRVKNNAQPTFVAKTVVSDTGVSHAMPTERKAQKKENDGKSLLDKCMPYIADGGGVKDSDKPVYELDSIESIINASENKAAELLEKLNNLGKISVETVSKPTAQENSENKKNDDIEMHREKVNDAPIATISDIDKTDDFTEKTVLFDAIDSAKKFEDITSGTKIIDLEDEMFEKEQQQPPTLLVNPFLLENEEFSVEDDYTCFSDAKRIGMKLINKLKSARTRLILTFIFEILLASPLIPSIHDILYVNQTFFGIISSAVFAVICLINYDSFAAIVSLFKRQYMPESVSGVLGIFSIFYAIQSLTAEKNPYYVLLFVSLSFVFKTFAVFMREAYIFGNFKIIASKNKKHAIKFIDDRQITFAMAKNSVDGDVLVGVDAPCVNVHDFIKNTEIDKVANSWFSVFTLISVIISLICGVFYGIYTSSFNGFLMALTVFSAILFAPTVFFTDILPLRSASKRLNRLSGMITGSTAANKIELANAVTIRSKDLFPSGTISLFNMKVLDSNKIDDTLLFAAAITKQIDSPYHAIFSEIAKTVDKKVPEADSVKYEEKLGISGWVGKRHVFIGNRTLLEAHGIKTPPLEVDKKILRNGYFPVYVASDEKPCALLMVKYNVDEALAFDLQKLCASGVTLLVDTCDPNITNEMVCDYFGLYEETVFVMGSSGAQLYKNSTKAEDDISSYAAHKGSGRAFISIFNAAAKIKRDITFLRIFHIISSVISAAVFIYSYYLNQVSPIVSGDAFLYILLAIVVSFIIHLFNKP